MKQLRGSPRPSPLSYIGRVHGIGGDVGKEEGGGPHVRSGRGGYSPTATSKKLRGTSSNYLATRAY